ncbi:MAG: SIMPL domain-containing protein [Candidatus Eremiobacteraeota bacterium]|nr:SIMPL domain-containing protein [Candidatus Eremiobacteraeota bacterium]
MLKYFGLASFLLTSLALTAPVALAQSPISAPIRQMPPGPRGPADNHGGITVSGAGQATGAAEQARVTLQIISRNNQMTLDAQTLQPVVDALIRAGADPKSVIEPPYLSGPAKSAYATLTATVKNPTADQLQRGVLTLSQTFAGMPDIAVQQAGVNLTIDDCTALRSSARRAALAQAHAQALDIAKQSNVSLGNVIAVQSYGDGGAGNPNSPSSCGSYYQLGPGTNAQFNSPDDYLRVRIFTNMTVTYAIR